MSEGKILRSSKRTFYCEMRSEDTLIVYRDSDTYIGWVFIKDFAFQETFKYVFTYGEVDELAGLIKKIKRYHEIHSKH